ALILDAQLDPPRGIHLDQIDELPGNHLGRESGGQALDSSPRQHSFEHAPDGAAQADFHFRHAQQVHRPVPHPLQFDVVDAHYFAAVHIDDLPVYEILLQIDEITIVLE